MIDPSATSLSLLQRIRNGEAAGWRRVVDLYEPLVQHWCRRWGVQAADADDLVQEVFQAAALGIATFSHDRTGDTFRGWLHTIARHKAMDFWRRDEQRPDVFGGSEALMRMQQVPDTDSDTNAEDPEDADQTSAVFHRALGLLRGEFRRAHLAGVLARHRRRPVRAGSRGRAGDDRQRRSHGQEPRPPPAARRIGRPGGLSLPHLSIRF